jgi:hypothetical protein
VYFPATDSSSDILETQLSEIVPLLNMEDQHIVSLEQALSELQARDVTTQQKLDLLINHITSQKTTEPSTNPESEIPTIPRPAPSTRGPPPALPSEFDGDRSRGMAFLRSCQT